MNVRSSCSKEGSDATASPTDVRSSIDHLARNSSGSVFAVQQPVEVPEVAEDVVLVPDDSVADRMPRLVEARLRSLHALHKLGDIHRRRKSTGILCRLPPPQLSTARAQVAHSVARAARRARRHGWLQIPSHDVGVKPAAYLPVYEELLGGLRGRHFAMLELGIWKGDSLAMWRDAFPRATIVGIDLSPPSLELGPRVVIVAGDQSDAALLDRVRAQHAPQGFDVIIDDAAHLGQLSARSLQALYRQHLNPGGLYIIEDWGTGYLHDWPDGRDPSAVVGTEHLDQCSPGAGQAEVDTPHQMPNHDYGMVGLVKRLIDHTAAGTLGFHQPNWVAEPLPIEWMRVQDGLAILKKPGKVARRRAETGE